MTNTTISSVSVNGGFSPSVVYAPYTPAPYTPLAMTSKDNKKGVSDVPYYSLDDMQNAIKTNQELEEMMFNAAHGYVYDDFSMHLGASSMASAKDSQIRMVRKSFIKRFNYYYDLKLNKHIQSQCLGAIFALDMLLGENSTKHLHAKFAVCD